MEKEITQEEEEEEEEEEENRVISIFCYNHRHCFGVCIEVP